MTHRPVALGLVLLVLAGVVLAWPRAGPAAAAGVPVQAISAGGAHTCALTTAGGVKCWGDNGVGQLGSGTGGSSFVPSAVVNVDEGVGAVDAGPNRSCFLTNAGGVKCSGLNHFGQLGHDRLDICFFFPCSLVPEYVQTLESGVAAVASGPGGTGGGHSCALMEAGGVKCWGINGTGGALGDGGACGQVCTTPIDVPGLESGLMSIAASDTGSTCAVTDAGGVKCWGGNFLGIPNCCSTPTDVPGLESGVVAVAVGGFHGCALTQAGGLKCWGSNNVGQLGDGSACGEACAPTDVLGLESGVTAVTAGPFLTCALTTAGTVKCWGDNSFGQLGLGASDGKPHPLPLDVMGLGAGVRAVDAGTFHVCAVTDGGGVKCWGANDYGQLGDGQACISLRGCPRPVDVIGLGAKAAPTPTPTAPEATATSTMPSATAPEPAATSTRPAVEGLPVTGVGSTPRDGIDLWVAALVVGVGVSLAGCGALRLLRRERAP